MAKKFLTDVNMNGNELQYAVVHSLSSAPANGTAGQIYYNSVDHKLYQHDGTSWVCVGTTYQLATGALTSNTVPIALSANGGVQDTVYIAGAGGATLTLNNNTLTITTADTNTTYTFSGTTGESGYVITITPSTGDPQTVTIPLSNAEAGEAGLMSASQNLKLSGIESGAQVNVQADWNQTTTTEDDYIKNKPTITNYGTGTGSDLSTGTSTTAKVWTPKVIHDYVASAAGGADAMRFKGTIGSGGTVTSLPSTHAIGDTYRVIEAGMYAGQNCEIGDLIIAITTSGTSSSDWTVAQTNIDGAITSLSGTTPITISGSGNSRTIAISPASGSSAGTMSSSHYTKLEGIESGAEANVQADWNQTTTTADDYIKNKPTLLTQQSATIAAGSTSTSISSSYTVLSYKAEMSNTEVVVDFSSSNNTWSIASAQSAAVTIKAVVSE